MRDSSYTVATLTNLTRFASITYGRPIGINEKDCNTHHPIDVCESPYFKRTNLLEADLTICYSSYQRELNKLYLIASPIIETIFGMRAVGPNERPSGPQYTDQITEVTEKLWVWRQRLPPHLLLDMASDCSIDQSRTARVHQLQALSLQLTFDNLLIIFNRPLIAKQVDHLIRTQPESGHGNALSPASLTNTESPFHAVHESSPLNRSHMSSTEQWWDAALRTSKVTELPRLSQLATDSHLVAFLAINLFNSAIVMAVLALSDPLSDRAQEVKRTITRIFRLQELLGKRTQLSMQSNAVLKDVIQMLLRREADAIFGESDVTRSHTGTAQMSVEDTLRLPTQLPPSGHNRQQQSTVDSMQRVHESMASVQRGKIDAFPKLRTNLITYFSQCFPPPSTASPVTTQPMSRNGARTTVVWITCLANTMIGQMLAPGTSTSKANWTGSAMTMVLMLLATAYTGSGILSGTSHNSSCRITNIF